MKIFFRSLREPHLVALTLICGVVARLVLVPIQPVGTGDLAYFWRHWMSYSAENGMISLYEQTSVMVNYPPFIPFLLYVAGIANSHCSSLFNSPESWVFFAKLPAIAADVCVSLLLYRLAHRLLGGFAPEGLTPAIVLAAWLLNPAVVYLSGVWGQVDSVLVAWLLASLACVLDRRWALAGLWLGLALLTKLQAIVLCPLLLLLTLRAGLSATARGAAAALCTVAAGLTPFFLAGVGAQVLESYVGAAGLYPRLTVGADNVWAVIGYLIQRSSGIIPHDTASAFGSVSFFQLGLAAFFTFVLVLLGGLGWALRQETASSRQAILILLATGLLYFGFFMLPTQMHERYVFPALAFLLIPALRSARIRAAYLLLALTTLASFILVEPPTEDLIGRIDSWIEVWKIRVLISTANCLVFAAFGVIFASCCRSKPDHA